MIRIVHTFGAKAGQAQDLAIARIRFGRGPDNEVAFDPHHDREASTYHAELRYEGGSWLLHDLGGRNGLFVRGQRVTGAVPVHHGDEIAFGARGPRVRVELVQPAQAAHPQPAQPPLARQPLARQPLARQPPAGQPPAQPPPAQVAPPPARRPAPPAAHAVSAAPPQAPPAGKRVGPKTMAAMVDSAVAAVAGRRPRKTQEIQLLVDAQVKAATKGQRRRAVVLGLLILVALGAAALIVVWGRKSQSEIEDLREELASLDPDDPRRKEIEGRLGKLHPENASFGRNLYDRSRKGIFMLSQGGQGFCTAFAIEPDVLATNAHCIVGAERRGLRVYAVENEGKGKVKHRVTEMTPHPAYRDQDMTRITQDVGIVRIDGRAAAVLELASEKSLKKLGAGDAIYVIGFPGRLMDASDPAATFLSANVGRITGSDGRPTSFRDEWLLQHDAPTTKGTSGSPIFDETGKVIAINAGGYLEGDEETIAGQKTEVVKASPYKFGMRIDLVESLL